MQGGKTDEYCFAESEKKYKSKSKDIPKVLIAITCTAVKDTQIL